MGLSIASPSPRPCLPGAMGRGTGGDRDGGGARAGGPHSTLAARTKGTRSAHPSSAPAEYGTHPNSGSRARTPQPEAGGGVTRRQRAEPGGTRGPAGRARFGGRDARCWEPGARSASRSRRLRSRDPPRPHRPSTFPQPSYPPGAAGKPRSSLRASCAPAWVGVWEL
jgi:hypothetical protein